MPELRKDPVVGRWVIISTERARRPGNIVDTTENHPKDDGKEECAFCQNQEQPIYEQGQVKVIAYRKSFLSIDREFQRTRQGLYDVINGYGAHEVIIETPEHIANMADLDIQQISTVLDVYAKRMEDLKEDPKFQFFIAYKNYGETAGSRRFAHARSHLIATPVNPIRSKEKFIGAKEYFQAHKSCIYCELIKQELGYKRRIVFETDHFLVCTPFASRLLFETLILPKVHHCDYAEGIKGVEEDLAFALKTLLTKFKIGLDDPAYNYMVQTAPIHRGLLETKKWSTITEDFHWHIELMPRLTRIAGFEKGTGFYICSIPPEQTAEFLRGVPING